MRNIILSTDSTSDLNREILDTYNIKQYPYSIIVGEKSYKDNIDISPEDIFKIYEEDKLLPKTAAINVAEYMDYFNNIQRENTPVIHINLAASLTSAHNNCLLAAGELERIYPVNSQNLSSGSGLLVLKAIDLMEEGLEADDLVKELENHRNKIHMSFLLDTLDFLHAGGRCSKVSSLGANLLKIKPVINVDNQSGSMHVGNKYKGSLVKTLKKYIKDKLTSNENINPHRIFLVHSGIDQKYIDIAKEEIMKVINFEKIYVTTASCTISSHCGPNTIGIAFETF